MHCDITMNTMHSGPNICARPGLCDLFFCWIYVELKKLKININLILISKYLVFKKEIIHQIFNNNKI